MELLLRRLIYAALIGPLAVFIFTIGAVFIYPSMILLNWLHGEDRPIVGARWVIEDGPAQDMIRNWPS